MGVEVPVFSPQMLAPQDTNLPKWLIGPAKEHKDAAKRTPVIFFAMDIKNLLEKLA
jgi:hypothetical protein